MILFITRKHPPSVGGMEKLSYEMIGAVGQIVPARVIAWRGPRWGWPLFAVLAAFKGLWVCLTHPVSFIHVSDPVLAPLGFFLARLTGRRWGLTAHGLDVLYPNRLYQATVLPCVRRADVVIAISEATRDACLSKGVAPARCKAIPVGLSPARDEVEREDALARLQNAFGLSLEGRPVLLTVGRLIHRKGVSWFVREVLPPLAQSHPHLVYLVAGDGPEGEAILQAAREAGVEDHIRLLGGISDAVLEDLYAAATVFVMPNVPVPGDMEGFGIVAIEAAARGVPVVAARIDGIPDAVADGENGFLLPPEQAKAWVSRLDLLLGDDALCQRLGQRARTFTRDRYRWDRLAQEYVAAFSLQASDTQADWDTAYLHVRRGEKRRYRRLLAFDIPQDALILDYGCGDGINTRLLTRLGHPRVVSMDYSLRLLRAGRPPRPVAGDGHNAPFADGAFDAVLVDGVLHHLAPQRALREIARILAPSGVLYLVEPAGSPVRRVLDWVTFSPLSLLWSELRHRRISLAAEWPTYQAWLRVERRLPEMIERAGLDILTLRRTPLNVIARCTRRETDRAHSNLGADRL